LFDLKRRNLRKNFSKRFGFPSREHYETWKGIIKRSREKAREKL